MRDKLYVVWITSSGPLRNGPAEAWDATHKEACSLWTNVEEATAHGEEVCDAVWAHYGSHCATYQVFEVSLDEFRHSNNAGSPPHFLK